MRTGGGSVIDYPGPMLGEPLPLELANTRYLTRGHPRDGLASVELLGAWLARVRSRLRLPLTDKDLRTIREVDLSAARDLRDCVQSLADASAGGDRPAADALDRLNRHARSAVLWDELRWETGPRVQLCSSTAAITTTICEIAADTV